LTAAVSMPAWAGISDRKIIGDFSGSGGVCQARL